MLACRAFSTSLLLEKISIPSHLHTCIWYGDFCQQVLWQLCLHCNQSCDYANQDFVIRLILLNDLLFSDWVMYFVPQFQLNHYFCKLYFSEFSGLGSCIQKSPARIGAGLVFPANPGSALEGGDLGGDCVGILGHCCRRCQPVVHIPGETNDTW